MTRKRFEKLLLIKYIIIFVAWILIMISVREGLGNSAKALIGGTMLLIAGMMCVQGDTDD